MLLSFSISGTASITHLCELLYWAYALVLDIHSARPRCSRAKCIPDVTELMLAVEAEVVLVCVCVEGLADGVCIKCRLRFTSSAPAVLSAQHSSHNPLWRGHSGAGQATLHCRQVLMSRE